VRDEPAGATRAGGEPVRTIFLGSGVFGIPTLRIVAAHRDVELVGVVTAPPRPAGRRQVPRPTPIEQMARSLGIGPILAPERLRTPEALAAVLELEPALAVLADYGQIVPAAILDLPHAALNLHPSLLPRYRGATPIPAAILAGDEETGVTTIRMDAGIDTGPIVGQERLPLDGRETTPELEDRLSALGAELIALTLGPWLAGELAPRPQDEAIATFTRPLRREDGRLRASLPASRLERQVRAYTPWPGSFVETSAGRLIVHAASVDDRPAGPAGTIDRVGLNTIEGRLAFERVQAAGGREMPWDDYLRGGAKVVGSSIVE
jgi:methionyl-tRNA formyltransferase